MNILGISCYYHDSAACLLRDGEIVAAIQEERLSRVKNTSEFPIRAINQCVQQGGIAFDEIDCIGFYEKPYLKFSRMVVDHVRAWPFSLRNFLETMPHWLQDRLVVPLTLKKELGFCGDVYFIKHHLSHAASSFFVSPFEEAALLTGDAVGEWAAMTCGCGQGNRIQIMRELHYPHSLGLLYTAVTTYLGFSANEGEGTTMALASCGEPRYLKTFREIVRVHDDGSFSIDARYFGFNKGSRMYRDRLVRELGSARAPGSDLEQRHCDIAASLQKFVEETLITIVRNLAQETKLKNLCLAGGVFLNCVANNRLLEETPFQDIFIQPAAGDCGGSLGVAAYISHALLGTPRTGAMTHAYLGTEYSAAQIKRALSGRGLAFREFDDDALIPHVARAIAQDKIVGWFQGKMEFGPRALGNRSILANPCNPNMKDLLNSRVKKRESFRPYAPVVLEERAGEFFEMRGTSPFMLLAPMVREDRKKDIPGVTHVDGTARVQTVNARSNPRLYRLIQEFAKITGVPIVINTSFNLRGEPIVCAPEDAIGCFQRSMMDALVLGNFVVERQGPG